MKTIKNGTIIKAIGGIYVVEAPDGIYECKARGIFRKQEIAPCCGDHVEIEIEEDNSGLITKINDRNNYLIRPPLANLDQIIFVISTCEPTPNLTILDKFIAISEYKDITPIIVITKVDLENISPIIDIYKNAGISVFLVDNLTGEGSDEVKEILRGKISAFTGNSGVGKSSLLNNILPNLDIKTNEISKKLGRGKHTTCHVELYKLDNGGYVADTPGFSTLETIQYDTILKQDLALCFIEFREFLNKCKFQDCSHTIEKGCAIIKAVEDGIISSSRHNNYILMYNEAKQIKAWELKK